MRALTHFLLTVIVILSLAGFAWISRYKYLMVTDAHFKSSLMSSVTVSQIIKRPVRIDRWTGHIEIYLEKGIWKDFSEWNDDKYGKIQLSVRQLSVSQES